MKVLIIGPGALGCLLAAKLSQANEVSLLDHDPGRAALLERSGLLLEEAGTQTRHSVIVTAEPAVIGPVELALLCVKSHQVEEAVAWARPALLGAKLFLALQNGISHLAVLPGLCPTNCWGLGVTTQGATLAGPGHVLHRGSGATWIGLPPKPGDEGTGQPLCQEALRSAAETMSAAGIPTDAVKDILPLLWGKLLVNVGINALTAINDCPNGALLEDPEISETMTAAVAEGAMVAEQLGIKLERAPQVAVREVCRATAANISSMLQDIRGGRATEIAAINGEVVRMATALGLKVPVNEELVRKVRQLEKKGARRE